MRACSVVLHSRLLAPCAEAEGFRFYKVGVLQRGKNEGDGERKGEETFSRTVDEIKYSDKDKFGNKTA